MTTEIALMSLMPDVNITSSEHERILHDMLSIVTKQDGCKSVWYGLPIEKPGTLEIIIDWASTSNPPTFAASPDLTLFFEKASAITTGEPRIIHSNSIGSFAPLEAGVTERVSAWFDAAQDEGEYLEENWGKTVDAVRENGVGSIKGMAGSWAQEAHHHPALGEGVDGKLFSCFIGWDSVDGHVEFRKTELYGRIIGRLKGESKVGDMWHTVFERFD